MSVENNNTSDVLETFMVEKKKVDNELLSLHRELEDLKVKQDILKEDSNIRQEESRVKYEVLEKKHKSLVDKLQERIECPVCLEVPEAGPVFTCSNGHLVCFKCKNDSCPTCRVKMYGEKSLLAVTVLENIEHKCRIQGCDQLLPLGGIGAHRKVCTYRLIRCPATLCGDKVAFCSIIEHLMTSCSQSFAKEDNWITDLTSETGFFTINFNVVEIEAYKVDTFLWNGKYFFLNIRRSGYSGDWTFHVEMLGEEEECSKYRAQLVLHKNKDVAVDDGYVYRFTGHPCSVEEEKDSKKETGLMVSNKMMAKLKQVTEVKTQDVFKISITFYKKL
eukprot:GFUD01042768.1.p1 GENE.GFUD01042768.1~~GFUD01042768.1.p1  ORF type:complete len:332 (-),score=65.07 GFUD01042768.1:20-1015(-)